MMPWICGTLVIYVVGVPYLLVLGSTTSSTTNAPPKPAAPTEAGLNSGDKAAIVLGILFVLLAVGVVILCLLYYKGYIGNREEQVTPLFPDIYTTPESLMICSNTAFEQDSIRKNKRLGKEYSPIIYVHDDIYHPPKSRPLPTDGAPLSIYEPPEIPYEMSRRERHSRQRTRRRRHAQSRSLSHSKSTEYSDMLRSKSADPAKTTASYPDDAVFIPDNGGMKFTMYYKTKSPYRDVHKLSKTV